MKRRLTAKDIREAAQLHLTEHSDQWIDAAALGKLTLRAKKAQTQAEEALKAIDVANAFRKFDLEEGEEAGYVVLDVGNTQITLLFARDEDGTWQVYPDVGDRRTRTIAKKARDTSFA